MEGEQQVQAPVSTAPKKSKLWLVIVAVLLIVIGGGYFAYSKFGNSGEGTLLPSLSSSKLNSSCKYNDPDLCKFVNNWKEVKNLTMSSTDNSGGKTTTSTFKMEGEDKSQIIMSESGKESYNAITIGNTTYTKDYSDNKWFKYTTKSEDIDDSDLNIDFDDKAEEVEDKTTYEKVGKEACGKFTCFKYKVIDPAVTDSTDYIWFDDKEYMLRKTRNESKDGTISEATYDYAKLSISEPSPVKEGDPYSGLTGSSTSAPSTPAPASIPSSIDTSDIPTESVPVPEEIPSETAPAEEIGE